MGRIEISSAAMRSASVNKTAADLETLKTAHTSLCECCNTSITIVKHTITTVPGFRYDQILLKEYMLAVLRVSEPSTEFRHQDKTGKAYQRTNRCQNHDDLKTQAEYLGNHQCTADRARKKKSAQAIRPTKCQRYQQPGFVAG